MPETQKYNGWTNYETWVTKLWIDNEDTSYRFWTEAAENTFAMAEPTSVFSKSEAARYSLADELKETIASPDDEVMPTQGLYADLLQAALSEVNWSEIADSLLGDVEGYESQK